MSIFTNPASGAKEDAIKYINALLNLLEGQDPLNVLQTMPAFVAEVVHGLSDAQLRRPEAPGKWSLVQVVQHLADSELVWAYRLRMILAQDRPEITGYDQDLWADRLNYQAADVNEALAQLKLLRQSNLRLLSSLDDAELARVGIHRERGEESLAHQLQLYAGHDLAHRRQLSRIRAGLES